VFVKLNQLAYPKIETVLAGLVGMPPAPKMQAVHSSLVDTWQDGTGNALSHACSLTGIHPCSTPTGHPMHSKT
jgi:hypothetical protein